MKDSEAAGLDELTWRKLGLASFLKRMSILYVVAFLRERMPEHIAVAREVRFG